MHRNDATKQFHSGDDRIAELIDEGPGWTSPPPTPTCRW